MIVLLIVMAIFAVAAVYLNFMDGGKK